MSNTSAGLYEDIDFAVLVQIAGRMMGQHVERIGRDLGYPAGHLTLLGMVQSKPDLVQNTYGEILAINDATLARYVDKLVRQGLVVRNKCKEDGRATRLRLSEDGEALVAQARAQLGGVRRTVEARLSAAQIRQLNTSLAQLLAAEGPELHGVDPPKG